jgi:hypothetical protein
VSTYVTMKTDGFAENLNDIVEYNTLDFQNVRRPYRGVEIKEDTYSIIKVIRSNGREIPLTDAGSLVTPTSLGLRTDRPKDGTTFNFSNFIAQNVVDSRSEKQQIVETFGDTFIFFYGEKPRIINVTGLLMNTVDFNWKNEFWKNYENYFRGTKLVELDARVYFYFDDQIVEGYVLAAQATHSAELPYHIPFTFTIFVTAHTYLGLTEDSGRYPISANVDIPVNNLRDVDNMNETIKQLRARKDKLRPDELLSTTWIVRHMAERAAGGVTGKQAIVSAIIRGMSNYEAKVNAFFDNVKTYFYGRRTIVPAGVAGAERLAGPAQYANQATSPGTYPLRIEPLRSDISDNYDEYTGGYRAKLKTESIEQLQDTEELSADAYEKKLLVEMAKMGVDVSKPSKAQTWRRDLTNTITKTADKIDFTAGIVRGSLGNLKHKTAQVAQVAQSLPGTITSAVTTPPPVVPIP